MPSAKPDFFGALGFESRGLRTWGSGFRACGVWVKSVEHAAALFCALNSSETLEHARACKNQYDNILGQIRRLRECYYCAVLAMQNTRHGAQAAHKVQV